MMDETMTRELIADHFAVAGTDELAAAEIFADDAVVPSSTREDR